MENQVLSFLDPQVPTDMNHRRQPASADQDPRSHAPLSTGATERWVTEIGYMVEVVL